MQEPTLKAPKTVTLDDMPSLVLTSILSHVSLKDNLVFFSVSKHMHRFKQNSYLWKERFKKHFPHRYLEAQRNDSSDSYKNYWYDTFKAVYADEYENLNKYNDLKPDIVAIFSAIKEGNIEKLQNLQLKNLYTYCDKNDFTPLRWVNKIKNQTVSDYLYNTCVIPYYQDGLTLDISMVDEHNRTALYWASCLGQPTETIRHLLQQKAAINITRDNGATALYIAAKNGHLDIVKTLLEYKADVHTAHQDDTTALHIAAENGHTDIVKILLEHDADVNAAFRHIKNQSRTGTALHIAAKKGYLTIVQILLSWNADIHMTWYDRKTALHIAVGKGHIDIVQTLLTNKADINKTYYGQATALHLAIEKGHISIAELLIVKRADINMQDRDHTTALHLASWFGYRDTVQILLDRRAHIDISYKTSQTALHFAVKKGHTNIVKILLANQADVNALDNKGKTPLNIALHLGHLDIVNTLIDYGADINTISKNDTQAMNMTAHQGDFDRAEGIKSTYHFCSIF